MPTSRRLALAAVVLFLSVVVLYLPTLRGGFVYDSIAQVLYSDYIHTPANWSDVLTLRVVGQDELDRNRPLHLASLILDAAIWGKEPFGYRLSSVLLHALNAVLLFVFLVIALRHGTTGGEDAAATPPVASWSPATAVIVSAAFGALVFALHPLVVEAVAEPSNREDLLVLLPMLLGLLAIAAPSRSPWVPNVALVLCCFFAVLAKESGIAIPFVFAVAAWLSGQFRRSLPGLLAGLLAAIGFLVVSYLWRPEASSILAHAPRGLAPDFWSLLALQSRIWALQLSQIVWPWNLSAHYSPQVLNDFTVPVAISMIGVTVAAVSFFARLNRLALLGVGIFVLGLLPASNLAPQYHPIADRYLYVPMAGLGFLAAIALASLLMAISKKRARAVLVAACVIVLCFEYAANVRRQIIWQHPATLWTDVLRQFPGSSQAFIGMANVHYRAGDFNSARVAATEAVVSSGGRWADAWALRAICQWRTGGGEQALESLSRAQSLSRVYTSVDGVEKALLFSPEQCQVIREMILTGPCVPDPREGHDL